MSNTIPGYIPFFDYFRLSTNSTIYNMAGDYSASGSFVIQPEAGVELEIYSLKFNICHLAASQEEFWGIGSALVNGIHIHLQQGNDTLADLTNGVAVKTTSEFIGLFTEVEHVELAGNLDSKILIMDLSLTGQPIVLKGSMNEKLAIDLADDLSNIHTFTAQALGFIRSRRY